MRKILFFAITSLALTLSACTPAARSNEDMPMGNGNSDVMDATPTPGSMMMDDPEAAHMMEPITAPNV